MLTIRRELVGRLVTGRGGTSGVLARWPREEAPHRGTLLRWLNGDRLPQSSNQLLALSGALDVDPCALWELESRTVDKAMALLTVALRERRWHKLYPALSFVSHFSGPVLEWPPANIARDYFHRDWCCADFRHTAEPSNRNTFKQILLHSAHPQGFHDPHVFHFAWREAEIATSAWRPYGFIEISPSESTLRLVQFVGRLQEIPMQKEATAISVETFFGPRPAEFRVASLHSFSCQLDAPMSDLPPIVRFD